MYTLSNPEVSDVVQISAKQNFYYVNKDSKGCNPAGVTSLMIQFTFWILIWTSDQ